MRGLRLLALIFGLLLIAGTAHGATCPTDATLCPAATFNSVKVGNTSGPAASTGDVNITGLFKINGLPVPTTFSIATANGFAGSVTAGATPVVTLSVTVTGALKGTAGALGQAAASDLTNGVTGSGLVVLQNTPTITTPVLNGAITGTSMGLTFASPPPLGSTLANTGAFTTISATGQITSTLATGTAPFVIASTTNVANLNASSLSGATFAAPGPIGSGTPSTAAFTTLSASSTVSGAGITALFASPPAIGGTVAAAGTFTALVANNSLTANVSGNISLNATGTVALSPTGALTVNPTAASTINNASVGQSTPLAGTFTALVANNSLTANVSGNISLNATGTVALSPTGALTVNPTAASTINNTSVGQTTAANGTFLSLKGGLRDYIAGCQGSAPGGATTETITACASVDTTNTIYMESGSTFTKTTASWTLGTGGGMLDTGATGGAASTWYHVYEMIRPDTGVVDFTMSLNATTPALPANYTKYRRIGSVFLDGSKNIRGFTQNSDEFLWIAQLSDINTAALGTTATTFAMSTPLGVKTTALIRGTMSNGSLGASMLINSPDETSIAGGSITTDNRTATNQTTTTRIPFLSYTRTNTSSQVRAVADAASTTVNAGAYGWLDTRGKDN